MALVVYDRVQETTATTGTGSITLGGAVTGYQSFAVVGNGNLVYYTILNGNTWEVGIGTYSTTGPTLARTTVLSNSNGNTSPISLSGSSFVWCDYPSEKAVYYDNNGTLTIGSTLGYSDTGIIASFASTVAGYNQVIFQNKSSNSGASSNLNVSNDAATATAGYAEFGINSSTFTGSGSFNLAGASYLASASTDLAIGTYGAYNIHFVTNSNTTDAMTIFNDGGASLGGLGDPGIGNVAVNNAVVGFTAITSSATAVSLLASSTQVQAVVGSVAQRINLPQATTLLKGTFYTISNASSANVTVYDNAGTLLETITPGGAAQFLCTSNATSAGTFGIRVFAASNVQWGNTALNYTGNITGATWNGVTIGTGYGGTGLTVFSSGTNALYSTSTTNLTSGTLPPAAGGTGVTTTPSNGQLLIGNGSNYTVATLGTSTGISTTTGSGTLTINNTGVTSAVAGTGIGVSGATGAVTISNTGVTSFTSSSGLSTNTSATGAVSVTNTGVTSAVAGTGISVSGSTGAVTITNAGVTSITGTASQITASASTGGVTLSLPSTINVNTSGNAANVTGIVAYANGGTGLSSTPANGQLDIGNGSGFTRSTLTAGTAIGISNGAGSITINNSGVTSLTTSSGLSTNTSATGAVSVTNTGVTSITGTASQITASASTGGVTLSLPNPINVNTSGNAATTSQTNFSNLTIGSSQVLYAGNYNSYAPTLTGGGASGTWSINVTGNAGNITTTAINYGSYGSIGVSGTTGGYAGISFSGVSGTLMMSSAASGFYYSNSTWRVYWDGSGNQNNTGNITAYASDKRLKYNIKNIPNALDKVCNLNGVTYNWDLEECAKWGFNPPVTDTGVIAQEVQAICSDAVKPAPFDIDPLNNNQSKSGNDYLTVQYEKLVPLLIEAIKDLKAEIELLKAK